MKLLFSYENKPNKTINPLKLKVKLSKNITIFKNDLNLEKERKKEKKKVRNYTIVMCTKWPCRCS